MAWLKNFKPGMTETCYFESRAELDTMCTLLSRFNKRHGIDEGIVLSGRRNWNDISFTVTCRSINEDKSITN